MTVAVAEDMRDRPLVARRADHEVQVRRPPRMAAERGGLLESNDGRVLRAAALVHLSILAQPRYIIHDDMVADRPLPVLDAWDPARLRTDLAYQSRQHLPAKARCFIDFLCEHFRRMDYDRNWTQ